MEAQEEEEQETEKKCPFLVNRRKDGWCGCQLHTERPRHPCTLLSGRV